jgi:HEAT repeat protein
MRALRIDLQVAFVNAALLILALTIVYAQEAGIASAKPQNLADATDEQMVAVLSSTSAEEAVKTLHESIDEYLAEGRTDQIERLMTKFVATADDNSRDTKDFVLEYARQCAKEGRRQDAEELLRQLPSLLGTVERRHVSEAASVLLDRAHRYVNERNREDMERLIRVLAPVMKETSLDRRARLHVLELLRLFVSAPFETTAAAAVEMVGQTLVDDPPDLGRDKAADIIPFELVRDRAVGILQESRRPEAVPLLKKAVLDERNAPQWRSGDSVRKAAIEALGWCGGPDAAAVLLELRSNESLSREDQEVTITALGRTGSAQVALPEILKIIEKGNLSDKHVALLGLGSGFNRYPPDARSKIMQAFLAGIGNPDDSVRKATCTAMKYTSDFYLIPLIEPLLDDPPVRPYAESAIRGLQRPMTEYRQMVGIPDEERDMSIEEVVQKSWAYNAIMLRWRLAHDQTKQGIFDKLAKSAVTSPDETVRRHVLRVFEQLPERRDDAVPVVISVLAKTQDPFTRDSCYKVLGRLGGPEAIRILKDAILKGPPKPGGNAWRHAGELYSNLYWYLGSCGPDAAPALFDIAKKLDRGDDYRLWAALAATQNEELVMSFLLEKARTAVEWKRSRALRSLCTLTYKSPPQTRGRIAEMLVQDADSEHHSIREAVAWGLGMVGDESHIVLLESMAAEDPYSSRQVGSRGEEKIDRIVYPIRDAAAKSIENISNRIAKEQEVAAE